MITMRLLLRCLALVLWLAHLSPAFATDAFRGTRFIGFKNLREFEKTDPGTNHVVFTSAKIAAGLPVTELIVSWSADVPAGTGLKFEASAFHEEHPTRWYTMGLWATDTRAHPRESVPGQRDDDGSVLTDTLKLKTPASLVQLRITSTGTNGHLPNLKFLGLCLSDASATPLPLPPNRKAWGKVLPVPELTQMAYPNGGVICSPTTVSMLLRFWAEKLKRPELAKDVPEIVEGVYDVNWGGTGNWPFNTAFAGAQKGMRGYVTRFSDVSELEDWIARGLPVGLSVCYDKLRGKPGGPSGHLVVCVGFTETGDVIINDPGTSLNVRKTFTRENVIKGWGHSRNTVYLIYPEGTKLPRDRFGHWE